MGITRLTAATVTPVSIPEMRAYLRLDSTSQDLVIELALKAAILFVQQKTSRVLAPAAFRFSTPAWCEGIQLPLLPARSAIAVSYLDQNGNEVLVDSANWRFERIGGRGWIWRNTSFTIPTLYTFSKDRVFVDFEAGYDPDEGTGTGDDPELVLRPDAKIVCMMLAQHWFEHRGVLGGTASGGNTLKPFELASESLLQGLRVFNP